MNKIFKSARSLLTLPNEDIAIEVNSLTKDYGKGRGIFDVSFNIPKGSTFGICGTNGAGKTTTIRHIMGFIKPDKGYVKVKGLNSWENAADIKKYIGYLPGEIAFPSFHTGSDFLKFQQELVGLNDMSYAEKIINALQLDPTANLRRMSKGMKQKTAIVAAFMHSPEIIILDEPTTGLDPLMREAFIDIVKEEKTKGTTIVMSNHMFEELEETCDYVAFIKDGYLMNIVDMKEIHDRNEREYLIGFKTKQGFEDIDKTNLTILEEDPTFNSYIVRIENSKLDYLFEELNKHEVSIIKEIKYTLEDYFMKNVIKEDM